MDVDKLLKHILGDGGAQAIRKGLNAWPQSFDALIPRIMLAWVQNTDSYQGDIPGTEGTIDFRKSEDGSYEGSATLKDHTFDFDRSSPFRVASVISVLIGVEAPKSVELRMAKSLDALAKVQAGRAAIKPTQVYANDTHHVIDQGYGATPYSIHHTHSGIPASSPIDRLGYARKLADWYHDKYGGVFVAKRDLDANDGYTFTHELEDHRGHASSKVTAYAKTGQPVGHATFLHSSHGLTPTIVQVADEHQRRGVASAMYKHAQKVTGKAVVALQKGNEPHGSAQPPNAPKGPIGPVAVQPKRSKRPQTKPKPTMSLTRSEMGLKCRLCGAPQFVDNAFVGCICLESFAKSVRTIAYKDGVRLEVQADEDTEELFTTLRKQFKR